MNYFIRNKIIIYTFLFLSPFIIFLEIINQNYSEVDYVILRDLFKYCVFNVSAIFTFYVFLSYVLKRSNAFIFISTFILLEYLFFSLLDLKSF